MLQIQVDDPKNRSLHFPPLQKRIRGTVDLLRTTDFDAQRLRSTWPDAVPGQILQLEGDRATIIEPLHEPKHARIRERIEAQGKRLPPARQEFEGVDVATWAYWMSRAVDDGIARIVSGTLPTYSGQPKKRFLGVDYIDQRDRMAKKQLAAQLAVMTPAQRKEYDRILQEMDAE